MCLATRRRRSSPYRFPDIRDYTTLAETMSPSDNFQLVKSLNGRMFHPGAAGFANSVPGRRDHGDLPVPVYPRPAGGSRYATQPERVQIQERLRGTESPSRSASACTPPDRSWLGHRRRAPMDAATISDTVNTQFPYRFRRQYYGHPSCLPVTAQPDRGAGCFPPALPYQVQVGEPEK